MAICQDQASVMRFVEMGSTMDSGSVTMGIPRTGMVVITTAELSMATTVMEGLLRQQTHARNGVEMEET